MEAIRPVNRTLDPDRLPRIPAAMFAIIKEAGDPESSLQKLAQVVSMEPVFTTQVLKVANSPYMGLPNEIRQIQQATIVLGARTLRNLAVAHAVRGTTQGLDFGQFDSTLFWEDSLRRAAIAQHLAEKIGYEDPMEAFTVGLIQDIGSLFLAYLSPEHSVELQAARKLAGPARHDRERELVGAGHTDLLAMVASSWRMPQDLLDAIIGHHNPHAKASGRRGQWLLVLARISDAIADLFQAGATRKLQKVAEEQLAQLPFKEPLVLSELCDEIREELCEYGRVLDIKVREQPSWTDMVNAANHSLLQIHESYELLTRELERKNDENKLLLAELQKKNNELRLLATTDTLTQVANRGRFTELLVKAVETAITESKPITILMCDADYFKRVNDTHGHPVGDEVLVEMAARMVRVTRDQDTVGRMGGEEFAVLLPGTGASRGQVIAERIRQALRLKPIICRDGIQVRQTMSIGGFTWNPGRAPVSADQMLQASDQGCYTSKRHGRDRVSWQR
jgi:diguanylate cyclase (GGDEF)-like protein